MFSYKLKAWKISTSRRINLKDERRERYLSKTFSSQDPRSVVNGKCLASRAVALFFESRLLKFCTHEFAEVESSLSLYCSSQSIRAVWRRRKSSLAGRDLREFRNFLLMLYPSVAAVEHQYKNSNSPSKLLLRHTNTVFPVTIPAGCLLWLHEFSS